MSMLLAYMLAVGLATLPSTVNAASAVAAADKAAIITTLEGVIKQAEADTIKDVDPVIATLKGAIEKGKAVIATVAAQDSTNRKVLEFVAANVDKIYGETLESIETNWHKGGAIKAAGMGAVYEKVAEHSPASVAINTVVHPVTAILALQAYKKDQKRDHLNQVVTELKELIDGMKNL